MTTAGIDRNDAELEMKVSLAPGHGRMQPGSLRAYTDGRVVLRRGAREWQFGPKASVDTSEQGEVVVADATTPERLVRLRFGDVPTITVEQRLAIVAALLVVVPAAVLLLGVSAQVVGVGVILVISLALRGRSDGTAERQCFLEHAELVGHGHFDDAKADLTWVPTVALADPVDRRDRRLMFVEYAAGSLGALPFVLAAPFPLTASETANLVLSVAIDVAVLWWAAIRVSRLPWRRVSRDVLFALVIIGGVWVPHIVALAWRTGALGP